MRAIWGAGRKQSRNMVATMPPLAAILERKLRAALSPTLLHVVDDSAGHRGHAGSRPGGETHFRVTVVSEVFRGRSLLERQRLVHDVLAEELSERIHALSLDLRAPASRPPRV